MKAFSSKLKILLLLFLLPTLTFAKVVPFTLFNDHMVLQRDVKIPIWGQASPNEAITISLNNKTVTTTADSDGNWMVEFPKQDAGGPYEMEISGENKITINDVYVGDVWLCSGQSNMDMTVAKEDRYWCGVYNEAEEVANANYPEIRVFDVDFTPTNTIQTNAVGKWEICSPETVGHFSAVAYFFARDIYNRYKIPIGLLTSAYGASTAETWISEEALRKSPGLKSLLDAYTDKWEKYVGDSAALNKKYREEMSKYEGNIAALKASSGDVTMKLPRAPKNPDPSQDQHNPYVCYNGMIAPLIPYAIKGALWYQGESNGPSADLYREIMGALVSDWRTRWGEGNFPFFYVQLANYGKPMEKPVEDGSMMTVREAQVQNLSIPNSGMVVAIDNADDPTNIHPKNKQEIGRRLSLLARAEVYGEEKLPYSGPIYKKYKIKGDKVILYFDHVEEGLKAKDGKLTGFAICGEDHKWVWANAKIVKKTVVVSSPEVPNPVAVRYAWGTNPPASLYNSAGLWAPNFRTDNFNAYEISTF